LFTTPLKYFVLFSFSAVHWLLTEKWSGETAQKTENFCLSKNALVIPVSHSQPPPLPFEKKGEIFSVLFINLT